MIIYNYLFTTINDVTFRQWRRNIRLLQKNPPCTKIVIFIVLFYTVVWLYN